ncbi:unnamed protein product [Cladocopium goreaui]|uniref:Uncharacterized protein n=1 Tax=Cladocopium goreaui TaxID=2562237 RepID=A0A9P1C7Y4_9DINO|nr:unnamed protein product [Cladocopium goreaui]
MERNAFVRPSDDWDAMPAMSDSDCEVFADSPRVKRSLALAKRPQVGAAKELKMRQNDRKMWEDITTDDEDTFPRWAPQARLVAPPPLPATEEGSGSDGEGLSWDPICLGSTSSVTELLWNKTKLDAGAAGMQQGTIFDKWSWSTTASETAPQEQALGTLPVYEASVHNSQETTPKSSSSQERSVDISETEGLERADPPQFPGPTGLPLRQLPVDAVPIQMPMLQSQAETAAYPTVAIPQMPQMPQMPQIPQMILPLVAPVAPAPLAPGPLGPMVSGQFPMNLGMLPILMSMPQPAAPVKPQADEVARQGRDLAAIQGPPFGRAHRFHQKNNCMGVLSADARTFTKRYNKGRLSIICENKVHFHGSVNYAVQFTEGELCSADGVGFILSSDLPCTRNIQKIVSIFANRTGRICIRVHDEVVRCPQRVKCLEIGDWLEVKADLVNQTVSFTVWPQDPSAEPSFATVSFKETFKEARGRVNGLPRAPCGFLAVVVKHLGVSVNLGS